ncbi:preprotein translocase subunit YajC [Brachymonas denitrificans]|uniref:preprotein translocase subunit YajC n=1 Tax=Brachymonas denitrificans TaxID=28220 RepID=UPI002B002C7B|nr:preprotein translocase subunit YajC [Brachymonas denitrificans]
MFISNAYAQAAGGASGDPMSSIMSFLPMIAMFAVLYFVMIRPQMRKQKEHRAMVEALAAGDEVVTAGGILGKVTRVRDGNVDVQVANGVEVQLQKSAVVQVLPKGTIK